MVQIRCPYCETVFDTTNGLRCPGCGMEWTQVQTQLAPQPVQEEYVQPRKTRPLPWVGPLIGLVVIFVVIILLLYTPLGSYLFHVMSGTPSSATFTVKRSVSFTSTKTISYEVHLAKPVSGIGQTVRSVSPSSGSTESTINGTAWYSWVGSGNTASLGLTVTVHTEEKKWKIADDEAGNESKIPSELKVKYLGVEWKIDPYAGEIATLSKNITKNCTNVYEKLEAIYKYIVKNIRYVKGTSGEPNDPITTLHTGVGDCDDQSILFCSLSRAAGVPAWLELGALYVSQEGNWGPHAWVRTYIPYINGSGVYVNIDTANAMFLARDALRYTDWVSTGNGDDLRYYYFFFTYSYTGGKPDVSLHDDISTVSMDIQYGLHTFACDFRKVIFIHAVSRC